MKKKLMIAAVAAAVVVAQSAPVFADPPPTNGNCTPNTTWTNGWLPCFGDHGNSGSRNGK